MGTEEMAQLVKYLLCKHEGLGLDPQHKQKRFIRLYCRIIIVFKHLYWPAPRVLTRYALSCSH